MVIAIITAGGKGERIGGPVKKQFIPIAGKPLLNYTIEAFAKISRVDYLIIVLPEDELSNYSCPKFRNKTILMTAGGTKRAESVLNGLKNAKDYFNKTNIPEPERFVLIHDGARPFVCSRLINEIIDGTVLAGAAVPVIPLSDTIMRINSENKTADYPPRDYFRSVQTPQGYQLSVILKAYEKAGEDAMDAKDESVLVNRCGFNIRLIEGDRMNIKITTAEDLMVAESIFSHKK